MQENTIRDIELKDIDISSLNVRHSDPRKDLDELKESIKIHGLLQPVVLVGTFGKPKYHLIAGQRRLLAHQELGLKTIRCVFEHKLNKTEIIIRSLVENLQRLDLDYADTAKAITDLFKKHDKDEYKVSKVTGLSVRRIRDYVSIEALATEHMKALLSKGKVTPADVKRAIKAGNGNTSKAEEILDLVANYSLSINQKKRIVTYAEKDKKATAKQLLEKAMAPHIEETIVVSVSEDLRKALELAVKKTNMEPEEFITNAIREWLYEKGFLG